MGNALVNLKQADSEPNTYNQQKVYNKIKLLDRPLFVSQNESSIQSMEQPSVVLVRLMHSMTQKFSTAAPQHLNFRCVLIKGDRKSPN